MRKANIVMVLAVVLLATPLLAGVASAGDSTNNTITPSVEQGTTDRLGGGDWVVVHAGNTNFGVVYGTTRDPNKLYIVADYKRYIAGVDYYDAQGNFIKTQGVPVWTVFAQSLDRFIEFKDTDGNHRFDMRMWNGTMENHDIPVKMQYYICNTCFSKLNTYICGITCQVASIWRICIDCIVSRR